MLLLMLLLLRIDKVFRLLLVRLLLFDCQQLNGSALVRRGRQITQTVRERCPNGVPSSMTMTDRNRKDYYESVGHKTIPSFIQQASQDKSVHPALKQTKREEKTTPTHSNRCNRHSHAMGLSASQMALTGRVRSRLTDYNL